MSIQKKVASVMAKLQNMYKTGLIPYPRIDNNFIDSTKSYDMAPHPPFGITGGIMSEIGEKESILDKNSAILFLSLIRLTSPSNIESFIELVDNFFDDDLNFTSKEKEIEAEDAIKSLEKFLAENNLKHPDVLKLYKNIFEESKDRLFTHYKVKNLNFIATGETRILKTMPFLCELEDEPCAEEAEVKNNDEDAPDKIFLKRRLKDAIDDYDRRKKLREALTPGLENKKTKEL